MIIIIYLFAAISASKLTHLAFKMANSASKVIVDFILKGNTGIHFMNCISFDVTVLTWREASHDGQRVNLDCGVNERSGEKER